MNKNYYQSTLGTLGSLTAAVILGFATTVLTAKQPTKDLEITKAVEIALKDFPPTSELKTEVKVENGVVTLTGNSANLPLKNLASETVGTIRGVKAIVNRLEIRDTDKDDQQIQQDIDRLFALSYGDSDKAIEYRTNDGVVTLNGAVSGMGVSRLAEEMVSSVVGVRSVINLLRVTPFADRSDDEIRQYLALKLKGNPWVDRELVKIEVEDGVVHFHGAVDSMSERSRLVRLADIRGISVNDDNLVVSPELRPQMQRPHRPVFRSDQELKTSLAEAFRQDPRLERTEVEIDVIDSDITLAGSVSSIGAISAAERIAAELPGAQNVYSFLYVRTSAEMSDSNLEQSIGQLFSNDALLADSTIKATVKEGVVTLDGMADSVYDRRHAMKLARNTTGVKRVVSKLRIKWDTPTAYSDSK